MHDKATLRLVAELSRQNLSVDTRGFPKAIGLADLANPTLRRYWNASAAELGMQGGTV
jgi:hypothetical protein